MNKHFKEFVTYKTLGLKHGFSSAIDLSDVIGDGNKVGGMEIKNVCTKMTKQLSDRIDNTVSFLDIRKRKFIEMAIIQALDDADELMNEHLFGDEEWVEANRTDKESK